jgi:hypothetical protein
LGDLIDLPGFEVPAMSQNTPGDASQFVGECDRQYVAVLFGVQF